MIRQIWIRIILLLALAVIPVILLQLRLQEDSISLVYSLAEKTEVRGILDEFLGHLREDARNQPEKEAVLKEKFQGVLSGKQALEGFFLAQDSIYRNIRYQTLALSLLVLVISLVGSLLISRGIVKRAQSLIREREKAAAKLRDLSALQNWQNVAKTLVHELRAPMTPIKLVASDLDFKRQNLSPEKFDRYLVEAQKLMNEQIDAIEKMIEGFTLFGKLPLPQLQSHSLHQFLKGFVSTYGKAFGEGVTMRLELSEPEHERQLDPKLLRDLFFNLCKNAAEANDGYTLIEIRYRRNEESDQILLHNSGATIPESVAKTLFDPYVSTKSGTNMGLGLAIARKIALDHKGDLSLVEGPSGVTFLFDLPLDTKA